MSAGRQRMEDRTRAQPWWRGVDHGRRLEGKRALVTGAGCSPGTDLMGVGEAIAVLFAAQGAKVTIADISAERADGTRRMVEEVGGEAVTAVRDLTSLSDNARCVQAAVEAFGGLEIVVNNLALSHGGGSPVDVSLEVWDRVMDVNLRAALLTTRHTVPFLKDAGGGSIVNISSIAAIRGFGSGAYAASKSALLGLTRDWAYILGRDNIRVNCIVPGHVFTPMGDQGGPEFRERRRRAGLLPAEGLAWDVAWPAVFLASDESQWMTGVELPVDAGTTSSSALAIQVLNDRR